MVSQFRLRGTREIASSRRFLHLWTKVQKHGQDKIPHYVEELWDSCRQSPEMLVPWPPTEGGNVIVTKVPLSPGEQFATRLSVVYLMPIVYVDVNTVVTLVNHGKATWKDTEVEIRVEKEKWVKGIAVDERLTRRAVLRIRNESTGKVTSSSRSHTCIRWSSIISGDLDLPRLKTTTTTTTMMRRRENIFTLISRLQLWRETRRNSLRRMHASFLPSPNRSIFLPQTR